MKKLIVSEEIIINTNNKVELVNITSIINQIIKKYCITEALINISTKHTTSSIIINEDEKGLKKDILNFFEKLVPYDNYYHDIIDYNARSHLKSLISSPNQTLPILDGKLSLGVWQSIFFLELDGPRTNRKIIITIVN